MLILALFGSPRKNGNTDLMAEAFLEGASSVAPDLRIERLHVSDLSVSGCLGCGYCDSKGVCVQRDDMDRVLSLLDSADRVLLAAPIYFYGFPGQLKLLIDRSQAPYMRRELARKQGKISGDSTPRRRAFLLSAGATRGKRLFDCAVLTAKYFFDALEIDYAGELCFKELDEKGAVLRRPDALEACRNAGREFVRDWKNPT